MGLKEILECVSGDAELHEISLLCTKIEAPSARYNPVDQFA
jgi:hypothetical protein